ncbi:MAG: hypothetical protein ACK4VO_07965 [Pseudobdellovibrio sp.]
MKKVNLFNQQAVSKLFIALIFLSLSAASCAKKSSSNRGTPKTVAQTLNAQTTIASQQAAASQNLSYVLNKIDWPMANGDGSVSVTSEIKNLQSQYLPVTTTHQSNQDANGIYDDAINGVKLDIRARCVGQGCDAYYMLITVIKNNYAYHQIAAVSFNTDCDYTVEHRNFQTAKLYSNLQDVVNQMQSVPRKMDCVSE